MNGELVFSSTGSQLMAGILIGLILTFFGLILSVIVDFLFGRRADREHVLLMGLICMVFSITDAYFDTRTWFNILQGLLTIVGFSLVSGYLKSKWLSVRNYLTYTVWNFSSKKEM